jgi:hypothetical protein
MIPKARKNDILVHRVDDEVVVYDKKRSEAHRLNRTASEVWDLIDGERSIADIAAALSIDESIVSLSVDELARVRLLDACESLSLSRRAAVRRIAAAAAIGFVLPAITSIVAPTPAQAESGHDFQGPSPRGRRRGQAPDLDTSTTHPRRIGFGRLRSR